MVSIQEKLVLWTGERHCGKTTSVAKLAQKVRNEGFNICGLLAPCMYRNGKLVGFDVFDLQSNNRAPLARRKVGKSKAGPFKFIADGFRLGDIALSTEAVKSADLVIVDEFGPLELKGRGWRKSVDSLLISSRALILLVVRRELVSAVKKLYKKFPQRELVANNQDSINDVITILKNRCGYVEEQKVQLDGMLMIGSAGLKVGKTELACALIKKFSKERDIIGIKVTTIRKKDGQCPRGGWGCGVCSSLDGNFCITQETNRDSGKDTSKLLAAGAREVFWLRVMKTHLKEGIKALLDVIGPDAVSICESNSLRQAVQPGVFLMVKSPDVKVWKSSANEVKQYADKIIVSDGSRFDFDLDRIKLINGKWVLQEQATAIIMAGGASSRMGVDKSMLMLGGKPMIEKIYQQLRGTFSQIIISANEIDKFKSLGAKVVSDREPGQGPLMGIASALEVSANELNFVVGCDIPYIDLAFVRRMLSEADGFDVVIPTTGKRKYEPLFAVYRKSALGAINETLSAGRRKITDVFKLCRVKYVEIGDASWLVNINTMSDYEEFRKRQSP